MLTFPALTFAQTAAGSIAGTVRDATGAVLPGVTVEASSPALIEKARVVDQLMETGNTRIIELRPGTYTVTFTLPGFNTLRREGIELTTGFTATVNAEFRVGAVAETITVTGDPPVVDLQNTKQQVVMTRDVIDSVPTGKSFQNLGVLIPGIVGGQVVGSTVSPGRRRTVGPELHDDGDSWRAADRPADRDRRDVDVRVDETRFVGRRVHGRELRGVRHRRRRQIGRVARPAACAST